VTLCENAAGALYIVNMVLKRSAGKVHSINSMCRDFEAGCPSCCQLIGYSKIIPYTKFEDFGFICF